MPNTTSYTQLVQALLTEVPPDLQPDYDQLAPLAGGVVSLILATKNVTPDHPHSQLVIKHTLDQIEMTSGPFAGRDQDTLLTIAPQTHALDLKVLDLLQNSSQVTVPTLLWGDPQKRVTLMRDFRSDGYTLLQELLVTGQLDQKVAFSVGKTLATLVTAFKEMSVQLEAVETTELQAEERLDELLTFLRPNISLFREIKAHFSQGDHLIPTDGHPKNIAVNSENECMVFDFGRSIVADPQFVAPNFAAHIGLGVVGNCFEKVEEGIQFIQDFIDSYHQQSEPDYQIEEKWFVYYFTAELLHRGLSGRWIDQRIFAKSSLQEVERAIHDFCIEVFRPESGEPIITIEPLLNLLAEIASKVQQGQYRGRR